MESTHVDHGPRRVAATAVVLAALWVVLAFARSGVTYHLAPLIVAAIPPAGYGIERSGSQRSIGLWAAAGAALALAVTFLLSAAGRLTGPSLLPFGGAVAEAVIFGAAGAVGGLAIGIWAWRADQ